MIAGQDYEPFYYNAGTQGVQGACYEIAQKICDLEKEHCKFKITPLRHSLELLKTGRADMGCPFVFSPQRHSVYHMQALFQSKYSFFALPSLATTIRSYEDLRGQRVGVLSPSGTELSLRGIHEFWNKIFEIQPEKTIFAGLLKTEKKAVPVFYGNRDVSLKWIRRTRSSLMEMRRLGEPVTYYMAFSRESISTETFVRYQKHFLALEQDGTLQKISDKYNLRQAPQTMAVPKTP